LLLPPPEETNIEPFHKADLSGTEIDVFIFLGKSIEAKKKKKPPTAVLYADPFPLQSLILLFLYSHSSSSLAFFSRP
jgi:hypothetical protein